MSDKAMGDSGYTRIPEDLYETEEWVSRAVLPHLEALGVARMDWVWEPACGTGKMSRVLEVRYRVLSTDHTPRGYGFGAPVDFLAQERPFATGTRAIVTNPPYSDAEAFIRTALALLLPTGGVVAMLLRNEYDSARGRNELFTGGFCFARKVVLTSRPRWIEGSTGSPRHNYAWFLWTPGLPRRAPTLAYGHRGDGR